MTPVKHAYDPSDVVPPVGHWIHGCARTDGASELDVARPSDGQVHGCIPQADKGVVDASVASARSGHRVADHVTWGITRNAGQLCYAGARLVVEESIVDDLVKRVARRMQMLVPGPTWSPQTTFPPIISRKQCTRIATLVRSTCDEGAISRCGAEAFEVEGGSFFRPTILDGVQDGMTGYREEIFGPALCIQRFKTREEGLQLARHPVYGLSAAVFTRDVTTALSAARSLKAGTVWINRWGRTPEMMTSPFGGYGQSGFGKESGRQGIEGFMRAKAVWIDFGETAELSQGGRK